MQHTKPIKTKETAVDILLIEDDPNDAELSIRELKKHNLINNIIHLTDGNAAVEYFFDEGNLKEFNRPQIILLDLKLPLISGTEVLSKLKSCIETRQIPVIIMTSSKEHLDLQKCYDLGANSYIVKPVEFKQFSKTVKEVGLYWMLVNTPPDAV